jgi:hypothetical protein
VWNEAGVREIDRSLGIPEIGNLADDLIWRSPYDHPLDKLARDRADCLLDRGRVESLGQNFAVAAERVAKGVLHTGGVTSWPAPMVPTTSEPSRTAPAS